MTISRPYSAVFRSILIIILDISYFILYNNWI